MSIIKMSIAYPYAYHLANTYAHIDKSTRDYVVDFSDIDDAHLNKFAALIMQDEPALAAEALGPDNGLYETEVYPALMRHMKKIDNKHYQQQYIDILQKSIIAYLKKYMCALLDDALIEYNHDYKQDRKYGAM